MVLLEKMGMHTISSGNYVTSVNGMIHPDRIMKEHDFLYMLDGSWEICEDHETYKMQTNDLLILPAGRHHYGQKLCNPGNRHMYRHIIQKFHKPFSLHMKLLPAILFVNVH